MFLKSPVITIIACSIIPLFSVSLAFGELVLYLDFDEGKGDTVNDLSGKNNKVNIKGEPSRVNGKIGGCFRI